MNLYETRIDMRRFNEAAPLISAEAVFWFTDATHRGIDAIKPPKCRRSLSLFFWIVWNMELGNAVRGGLRGVGRDDLGRPRRMRPTAVNGIDQVSSSIKCCRRGVHALVSSAGERGSAAPLALGSGKLQSKATTKI